jgi:hypothetical protein
MENTERNMNHPVWNIYDLLRTSRLNILYYETKLQNTERLIITSQIILAATVPSSAIAGFEIWDFWIGKYAWEILISSSSIIAFIQPFLGLNKKAKMYSELIDGYKILYYDLQDIKEKIEEDKSFVNKHKKLFNNAKERRKKLQVKETGINLNKRLRKKSQNAVKRELPSNKFYIPQEE